MRNQLMVKEEEIQYLQENLSIVENERDQLKLTKNEQAAEIENKMFKIEQLERKMANLKTLHDDEIAEFRNQVEKCMLITLSFLI